MGTAAGTAYSGDPEPTIYPATTPTAEPSSSARPAIPLAELPLAEVYDRMAAEQGCRFGPAALVEVAPTGALLVVTGCRYGMAKAMALASGASWIQAGYAAIDGEPLPDLIGATPTEALQQGLRESEALFGPVHSVSVTSAPDLAKGVTRVIVDLPSTDGGKSQPYCARTFGVPFDAAHEAGDAYAAAVEGPSNSAPGNDGSPFDPTGIDLTDEAEAIMAAANAALDPMTQLVPRDGGVVARVVDGTREVAAIPVS